METFSADWLALREPADHAARAGRLEASLVTRLVEQGASEVAVVDLGAGAGSNARRLMPLLPLPQRWLLVDHDAALLGTALERTHRWAEARGATTTEVPAGLRLAHASGPVEMSTAVLDMTALSDTLSRHDVPSGASLLVTAAALLDLTSPEWLDLLAQHCHDTGATALFALTYDGRIEWTPSDPLDAVVRTLVNAHQHTDKGFGPAAGPDAVDACEAAFTRRGYVVDRARSDWTLGVESDVLQRQLVDGWTYAALAVAPERASDLRAWQARRLQHIASGASRILVGHHDLLAYPSGTGLTPR
jgi:hypothetical protein